ncbi:hypothetical protein PILCRDRAFT_86727 [Piloderma croceum F 1598]|uniref:Uncharacterized protein n=1 Tax=Piloderma croceum (strain F 1598) TaxID=765440 RepID=A0A0C3C8Q1_PILCF|nr:hypothetical protein PILCRDRAFT_86727 [Piloderma croceum F 1598]
MPPDRPQVQRHCRRCPGGPLRSQCIHTKAGQSFLAMIPNNSNVPGLLRLEGHEEHELAIPGSAFGMPTPLSFVIDPQLMGHSHSEQIGTVPQPSQGLELGDNSYNSTPIGLLNNGERIGQGSSSPSKSSTRDDRARPTTYNPLYGLVEGVKRGSMDWNVLRPKPLHPAETDSRKAASRFSRGMEDIVHPNAARQFVHYASSRLRREAKDDTKELVKQFQATINALMNAPRKDALEMGRVLESSCQELAQKEEEVRRQDDEIREKDALLAKYKGMLGIEK